MNDAVFIAREHSVKRKYIISSALDFRIQNIFSYYWTKIFVLRVVKDFFYQNSSLEGRLSSIVIHSLRKDPVSIETPKLEMQLQARRPCLRLTWSKISIFITQQNVINQTRTFILGVVFCKYSHNITLFKAFQKVLLPSLFMLFIYKIVFIFHFYDVTEHKTNVEFVIRDIMVSFLERNCFKSH